MANTLILLSTLEPASLGFLAFEGPESENGPVLRLVLTYTYGEGVGIG